RIVGVPEGPDTCSTAAVAALLKDAFGLEKEPVLDRSHRTLQPKPKSGERPRAISRRPGPGPCLTRFGVNFVILRELAMEYFIQLGFALHTTVSRRTLFQRRKQQNTLNS
ncbi:hypothetical protein AMELA_G00111790, partial [Ameiurus melas]